MSLTQGNQNNKEKQQGNALFEKLVIKMVWDWLP